MFKWEQLFSSNPSVVTIVGMAKNAGKTVTLNYLQKIMHNEGRSLGVTSIGRDGERYDALTNLAKPQIYVQQGTIVATASQVLENHEFWEHLQETEINTPLGHVVILRARSLAPVVLAGPSKNLEAKQVVCLLKSWGADCILVDGAFDRQSSADPLVSEQVILASGATLDRDLAQVISKTKCRVEQLTLPACEERYLRLIKKAKSKLMLVSEQDVQETFCITALLSKNEWLKLLTSQCSAVLVKGAVGEGLGEALLEIRQPPVVVVQDGTKIFISSELWRKLRTRKIWIQVEQPINLLGVTVNPTFPGVNGLDADALLQGMGKALYPLPVIDVAREAIYEK